MCKNFEITLRLFVFMFGVCVCVCVCVMCMCCVHVVVIRWTTWNLGRKTHENWLDKSGCVLG